MNPVFHLVMWMLQGISSVTGFTYREINIIVYFMIVPFVYVALIDRLWRRHVLKVVYFLAWAAGLIFLVPDFKAFLPCRKKGSPASIQR